MKSNFEFLNKYWPVLAQLGANAENYLYSDPNACIYKLGMFAERLVREILVFEHIDEPQTENTHANRIRSLKKAGLLPQEIDNTLYLLRKTRNSAVHTGTDSVDDAKMLFSMTYNLAVWFMETYGDWKYIADDFTMPKEVHQADLKSVIEDQEKKIVELSKKLAEVTTAVSGTTQQERVKRSQAVSSMMEWNEAQTRCLIDEQLRKAGWEADTVNLRYSKGTRPVKGRNIVISEWPTNSAFSKNGYADYAFFIGEKLVALMDAKKVSEDVASTIDVQVKDYAKHIKEEHKRYTIGLWDEYQVPFLFASNGRAFLEQLRTKSGIDYSYSLEYEYAQKSISIIKSGHAYRITADDSAIEGSYRKVRSFAQKNSLFPQRVVAFYSGTNNKLFPNIKVVNTRYTCLCRDTLRNFLKSMNDDSERFIPNFPKRKYNYCEEGFTPVYLLSILCGQKSFEKSYLIKACHFDKVKYVDMVVNTNKVEQIFGRGRFEGDVPTGLYYLTDFIDYRFTDLLRRGFMYSSNGKSYFQITNIDSVNIDSIAILEFFEKLYSLFETRFEVTVTQGESNVKCSEMSEGQRQLIKILGMLGICKTEDCLVLMDEPDAYMNPRWKYEIKETMDNSLRDAINTQAIVATHDPLVINGVPKEFIRIFTHNENLVSNNGYYFTKVIVPTEDTEGMGIDGLLQSEYYGLSSVLDSETKDKMDEKHRLLIKKKDGTITDNEKYKLLELTNDLENMSFTRNIPTDSYYDEYVAAMHKIYSERPHVNLSAEDIAERNAKAEEILKGLLEK